MTEPSITVSGPGGEYMMPHNVDTATFADACDQAAGVRARQETLQNFRRHLLSLDPSPEVRAALDQAIPAPSQPVTCKWHGYAHRHYVGASDATGGYWCPGPVSVPKESSE